MKGGCRVASARHAAVTPVEVVDRLVQLRLRQGRVNTAHQPAQADMQHNIRELR